LSGKPLKVQHGGDCGRDLKTSLGQKQLKVFPGAAPCSNRKCNSGIVLYNLVQNSKKESHNVDLVLSAAGCGWALTDFPVFSSLCLFDTGSLCVAQAGLKLEIPLPRLPQRSFHHHTLHFPIAF
jgi:hypothetical protein